MDSGVHICIFLFFQFVYILIIVFCVVGTTAALAYTHKRKVTGILSYLVGCTKVYFTETVLTLNIIFFSLMWTWLLLKMCFRTTVVIAKILIPKQWMPFSVRYLHRNL